MYFFSLCILLIHFTFQYPHLKSTSKDPDSFIPEGYHQIRRASGQLNGDTLTDYVFIIESNDLVSNLKEEGHDQKPRILFILFGDKEYGFKLAAQSNKSVMLSDDGGVFGDPLQELFIRNKVIHVNYFGGSTEKWAYTYKWRYQHGDWLLIGATYTSMSPYDNMLEKYDFNLNTGDMEHTIKPFLEEDEDVPTVTPKTKRYKIKKNKLYSLNSFQVGVNLIYKDINF
ncbi:MAG: hypothetical protein UZ08_BCD001002740 [Candidatus Parvibacillus calidus]|nr:MAG: hypothetical protein UZ08_BCD001002740 [Candidatus Parvibacillus calidus]